MVADNAKHTKLWDSSEFAEKYRPAEALMGQMGGVLLRQTGLSPETSDKLTVLDSACGTGVMTATLIDLLGDKAGEQLEATCLDISESMIDFVVKRIEHLGWKNVTAVLGDSQAPGLPDAHFTHVFITFSMMFFPKSLSAISESFRMLKPGGVFATATWKKPGWFAVVRAAFATDPSLPHFPQDSQVSAAISKDGQWDDEKWIKTAFLDQGFVNTKTQIVTTKSGIYMKDFINLNRGTVKMIMENFWSQEEREKYTERAHEAVAAYVTKEYPSGYTEWDWTAILATGSKPA